MHLQVIDDDPEYFDAAAIPDDEILWRGLLKRHLPEGPSGPISSSAFKTQQKDKIRRHISTYRKSIGRDELNEIWRKLPKSVALCDVQAVDARALQPEIVGVCDADEGLPSHSRIIRSRTVLDDDWQVVAVLLAEAAQVSLLR